MIDSGWRIEAGAQVTSTGVRFTVWAPVATSVEVELVEADGSRFEPIAHGEQGVWSGEISRVIAGAHYRFRIDGEGVYPDPYSRYQPEGVHGPSEVVDPSVFAWTDAEWTGLVAENLVIYEVHVGTYTKAGTFSALMDELPELKRLGINAIELMPVAQSPGARNWGYDGVNLFAPSHVYGRPEDLRRLVDAAHHLGLGVILDVVYNHLGPEGNYLSAFSPQYFSSRHQNDWGDGLNWDGDGGAFVRQFAIDNACAWISEYHLDGLRLDAVHAIIDDSPVHIVAELTAQARAVAMQAGRKIVSIAEDGNHEISDTRPVSEGGDGLDAIWADDFHHEMRVELTNAHENYYADYDGSTVSIAEAVNAGLVLTERQEGASPIQERDPASAFVFCIQNHDQIGNRPFGDRLHHDINLDRYAVASTLLLTSPETPLLFMGQEFAASTPFLYFTDHPAELGRLVTEGRRREFAGFPAFQDEHLRETIPDPQEESTFLPSKLNLNERSLNGGIYALYRELLQLRRTDPVLSHNDRSHTRASALTAQIIAIHRWWNGEHRIVFANLGFAVNLEIDQFDALASIGRQSWTRIFSTAESRFGGNGRHAEFSGTGSARVLRLPARSAAIWWVEE
ncbi:MAG: malto-oligosyltrehalose trehalohydrolase [Thermomicrobiales bacterium]